MQPTLPPILARAHEPLAPFRDRQNSKSENLKPVNDQLVSIDSHDSHVPRKIRYARNGTDPVPLCDQLNLRNASSTGWHTSIFSRFFRRELYASSVMRLSRGENAEYFHLASNIEALVFSLSLFFHVFFSLSFFFFFKTIQAGICSLVFLFFSFSFLRINSCSSKCTRGGHVAKYTDTISLLPSTTLSDGPRLNSISV